MINVIRIHTGIETITKYTISGDRFYKAMKRPGKVVGKGTAGGVTSEQKYASSGQKGQH